MAYKITEKCVQCGNCKDNCPVDAIIVEDGKYKIVADECVDCGTCEGNCKENAILAA